jgi:polar amino acid transport system permease protein
VQFDWAFLGDPRLADAIIAGLKTTLILSACSALGSLLIGVLLVITRVAGPRSLQLIAQWYTDLARNVPILITMFFFYFGLTSLFPPSDYTFLRTPHLGEIITIIAISLIMGAFVSEVLRQGIESVPVGQVEAGMATGLNASSIYRHVIVPQLLTLVLPGLSSEMVNVIKGTTFALTIGVADLMWQGQNLESETFKGVETMTAISVVYFFLSFATIAIFRGLELVYRMPGAKTP